MELRATLTLQYIVFAKPFADPPTVCPEKRAFQSRPRPAPVHLITCASPSTLLKFFYGDFRGKTSGVTRRKLSHMYQRGTKFYADYRDADGTRHRKSFTSSALAVEFERAQKAARHRAAMKSLIPSKAQATSPIACARTSTALVARPVSRRKPSSPPARARRPTKSQRPKS